VTACAALDLDPYEVVMEEPEETKGKIWRNNLKWTEVK
jgi:hypothetical protein